jgi:ubiquinone/menaquinone biosynthesis C-methylase UbiE
MSRLYVHGYGGRERARLQDQADALVTLLHSDTAYPDGSRVLEAGCGVGAQTISLARRSPGARIVSFDLSLASVETARAKVNAAGAPHVRFLQADLSRLPFDAGSFDHVFVCFVLEHLARPIEALETL